MAIIYTETGERKARVGEEVECPACGKIFTITNASQKYCPDCRKHPNAVRDMQRNIVNSKWHNEYASRKPEPVHKTCENCGKDFTYWTGMHHVHQDKRFCSPECRLEATAKETHCAYCGKLMWECPGDMWRPRDGHPWYCSEECRKKDARKKAKAAGLLKKCRMCGKEFIAKETTAKFCSKACATAWSRSDEGKAERKRGPAVCRECGKVLSGKEWRESLFSIKGFCSIACRRKHYAKTRTGRQEYCRICGRPFYWSAGEGDGFYCSEQCASVAEREK